MPRRNTEPRSHAKRPEPHPRHRWVDALGVAASLLCLVHCLATPLVVVLLPVVASERFEGALSWLLVVLASSSVVSAWGRGDRRPIGFYVMGLAALGLRAALGVAEGELADTVLILVAACGMIFTHVLGLRPLPLAAAARSPSC